MQGMSTVIRDSGNTQLRPSSDHEDAPGQYTGHNDSLYSACASSRRLTELTHDEIDRDPSPA